MTYELTAEMHLKNIIAESREVAQALNEFADTLESIQKKYEEPMVEIQKKCSTCKYKLKHAYEEPCTFCDRGNGCIDKWEPKA